MATLGQAETAAQPMMAEATTDGSDADRGEGLSLSPDTVGSVPATARHIEDPLPQGADASPSFELPKRKPLLCPVERQQMPEWVSFREAKQKAKQEEVVALAAIQSQSFINAPMPADRLAKEERFMEAVKARQAEFDAMPQLERELAYGALKDAMLQPGVDTQDSQPSSTLQGLQGAQPNGATPGAGVEHDQLMQYIYRASFYIPANTSFTVETLDDSIDTVINVQDYDTGAFVDGNDNCGTRLPGCPGYRSYLTIAPVSTARSVWIIVRDYWPHTGTLYDTLRITVGSNTPYDLNIQFTGGYHKSPTSFPNSSHFYTVEELGGTHDTVMLLTTGSAAHGIALDDDSGVGYMSTIHAPAACSSVCYVIVGSYSPSQEGPATFIGDEDADATGYDPDHDGLSNTLENVIGTSPYYGDTDGDGINDNEELLGVEDTQNIYDQLLRFPMYGANPLYRDIFIEADWPECVVGSGQCGSPPNPDLWRMTPQAALDSQRLYFQGIANLHFDIGVPNSDPDTKFIYNDWGGAKRHSGSKDSSDKCQWLSPSRLVFGSNVHYFHGIRTGSGAGNTPFGGQCSDANWQSGLTVSHERGHGFNLSHGGNHSGGPDMNCKPNYKSIMNYAWSDASLGAVFSANQYSSIVLNPTHMDETAPFGNQLSFLNNSVFRYQINPSTGGIDWNRNGIFETTPVRAAAAWAWAGCSQENYQADILGWQGRTYTALSYMPWSGVGARLYWFTRAVDTGKIEYRYATAFPENCGNPPSSSCKTNWSPNYGSAAPEVPSSVAGSEAPAAASYKNSSGTNVLVLVYKDTNDRLRYQTMTSSGGWSSAGFVGTGPVIEGSPAAITWGGSLYVYAIMNGYLYEWALSPTGIWSGPVAQQWSGSSYVDAAYGIGVTRGYLAGSPAGDDRLMAAIPSASPLGQLDLAFKYAPGGPWYKASTPTWGNGRKTTAIQPSVAYEPYDPGTPEEGRIYLAWGGPASTGCKIKIAFTEGNDLGVYGPSRRLVFVTPDVDYDGTCSTGNITLLYDLDHGSNLRGTHSYLDHDIQRVDFSPVADGIFNGSLKDQDDQSVILTNFRCPLGGICF